MLAATEAIQRYLTSRGKAEYTIKAYVSDVRMFFLETNIAEIELDSLEYQAALWLNRYRRIVAPKTTCRRLTSIRKLGLVFQREILKEYNTPTPAKGVPHPLPEGPTDLKRILAVASNDDQRVLVALLGLCGLRISEARGIGPSNFNLTSDPRTLTVFGKGDKQRVIPITNTAWDILCTTVTKAWIDKRPTLLVYSDRGARELITTLGLRAKISRPISSHDLRATFATAAYNNTNNLRVVQELLGHANVTQTELYTGVKMTEMAEAADFFDVDED